MGFFLGEAVGGGAPWQCPPPALSVSSHGSARLPARNDFLIMQPVLGIANPPPTQHPLLQLTPQPLIGVPRVVVPHPMPILGARAPTTAQRERGPARKG